MRFDHLKTSAEAIAELREMVGWHAAAIGPRNVASLRALLDCCLALVRREAAAEISGLAKAAREAERSGCTCDLLYGVHCGHDGRIAKIDAMEREALGRALGRQ